MKLTHQITGAFLLLAVVIAGATGVGLHYLEGIHFYQLQVEDEWKEYQRMVSAEDKLKELSTDISAWQAGILPVTQLKSKAGEIVKTLSSWTEDVNKDEQQSGFSDQDRREAKAFLEARQAFLELVRATDSLPAQPTAAASASLIQSLDRLRESSLPVRQGYFQNLQTDLAKVRKFHDKAQRGSIYYILIVGFLVTGISVYSIRILHRQAQKLMEQERQMASVTLVQNLAHEIRNPLGVIKSAASVIAQRSDPEMAGLADDISSEVVRVDGLLTDLLRLRRATDEPKTPTNIAAMVTKTADFFAPKIQMADLTLKVYNEGGDALCLCRPDAIKQVLMNLLLNAIEASPSKNTIEIRTAVQHRDYVLQVCDYGQGIAVNQRQKIFDLMYTTKPYGFGIGLTVVKRIIEDHGGRIEVVGLLPQGTAFTVFLPLKG